MKAIICIIIAAVLAVGAAAFAAKSHAADDIDAVPVRILVKCGSLVGSGEILVQFEGEVSGFKVECGLTSI